MGIEVSYGDLHYDSHSFDEFRVSSEADVLMVI